MLACYEIAGSSAAKQPPHSKIGFFRNHGSFALVDRTLDFLQAQGLVHKIESLNAYFGCSHPEKDHQGHFLICENCEEVRELEFSNFNQSIVEIGKAQQFHIKHLAVELFGLCNRCHDHRSEPA